MLQVIQVAKHTWYCLNRNLTLSTYAQLPMYKKSKIVNIVVTSAGNVNVIFGGMGYAKWREQHIFGVPLCCTYLCNSMISVQIVEYCTSRIIKTFMLQSLIYHIYAYICICMLINVVCEAIMLWLRKTSVSTTYVTLFPSHCWNQAECKGIMGMSCMLAPCCHQRNHWEA